MALKPRRRDCRSFLTLPLWWKTTAAALRAWLAVRGRVAASEVFVNARGEPLSRWGFAQLRIAVWTDHARDTRPVSAVVGIRRARKLSGVKLPSARSCTTVEDDPSPNLTRVTAYSTLSK